MATAKRYVKALSKLLGLNPIETHLILSSLTEHVKSSNFSIESMAKNLNRSMKSIQLKSLEEKLEKINRKRENPNALMYKQRIIELYQDNENGAGFGYKKIYQILLASCKNEEERKTVISSSSIRIHLHEKWNIPKNTNRRIPKEAIAVRKLQGVIFF